MILSESTILDKLRGMDNYQVQRRVVLFISIIWSSEVKYMAKKKINKTGAQHRNRCNFCGRPRGYIRFFGICRICFRDLASNAKLPGVTKSSW